MKRNNKNYDEEFKKRAVELVYTQDTTLKAIAEDLGMPESTLRQWRKKYGPRKDYYPNYKPEDNEEIRQLKKELARTREERDILKKAITICGSLDRKS